MTEEKLCLHCGTKLLKMTKELSWNYVCSQCGKGWGIDKNGNWHVFFARRIYPAEEAKEIQEIWRSKQRQKRNL